MAIFCVLPALVVIVIKQGDYPCGDDEIPRVPKNEAEGFGGVFGSRRRRFEPSDLFELCSREPLDVRPMLRPLEADDDVG